MNARILVLGAAGRLGHMAAEAFREAGWTVVSLVRPGSAVRAPVDTEVVEVHALDHAAVGAAARGADVVLHALNPSYTDWSRLALPLAYSAITAAETARATLLFPGNLYNYGSPLPPVIDENTPMRPSSRKGQLRVAIEDRMTEAAERGVRIIIVRAGDFYGGGRGSWFDLVLAKEIGRGRLTYPGPLDVYTTGPICPISLPRFHALPPFAKRSHRSRASAFPATRSLAGNSPARSPGRRAASFKSTAWPGGSSTRCGRSCRSVESYPKSPISGTNRTASTAASSRPRSAASRAPRLTLPPHAP